MARSKTNTITLIIGCTICSPIQYNDLQIYKINQNQSSTLNLRLRDIQKCTISSSLKQQEQNVQISEKYQLNTFWKYHQGYRMRSTSFLTYVTQMIPYNLFHGCTGTPIRLNQVQVLLDFFDNTGPHPLESIFLVIGFLSLLNTNFNYFLKRYKVISNDQQIRGTFCQLRFFF